MMIKVKLADGDKGVLIDIGRDRQGQVYFCVVNADGSISQLRRGDLKVVDREIMGLFEEVD